MKNDLSAVGGALELWRWSQEEGNAWGSAPELSSTGSWQEVGAHTGMAHIFVDS